MKHFHAALLVMSALVPAGAMAASTPKPGETVGYFLSKTEVAVTISQRIVRCPTDGQKMEVAAQAVIKPKVVADQYVEVDIRSGLFAERTTGLVLRPNGTLEAFNAKSAGQGGKILGAVTKAALTVAGFGAGGIAVMGDPEREMRPRPQKPSCNAATLKLLADRAAAIQRVDDLEAEIARDGETSPRIAMLERLDAEIDFLTDALTLNTKKKISDFTTGGDQLINPVDYGKWLDNYEAVSADVVGRHGYKLGLDIANVHPNIVKGDGTTNDKPVAALIYRRSVMVPVSFAPCLDAWDTAKSTCKDDESFEGAALTDTVRVPVPQLSGLFSLRVGRGGLFGTKEAKAKFDEFGTPTELEYGTSTGTDDAVSVIDTSIAGVSGVRDARLSELERRIAIAKARKELADLQAGGDEE
jgi:hypothetical protein